MGEASIAANGRKKALTKEQRLAIEKGLKAQREGNGEGSGSVSRLIELLELAMQHTPLQELLPSQEIVELDHERSGAAQQKIVEGAANLIKAAKKFRTLMLPAETDSAWRAYLQRYLWALGTDHVEDQDDQQESAGGAAIFLRAVHDLAGLPIPKRKSSKVVNDNHLMVRAVCLYLVEAGQIPQWSWGDSLEHKGAVKERQHEKPIPNSETAWLILAVADHLDFPRGINSQLKYALETYGRLLKQERRNPTIRDLAWVEPAGSS